MLVLCFYAASYMCYFLFNLLFDVSAEVVGEDYWIVQSTVEAFSEPERYFMNRS